MCVSFCYRQGWLYLNHEDCRANECQWAEGSYAACRSCLHCREDRCYLTNALHPVDGCCHHNVPLNLHGRQPVTRHMMTMWAVAGVIETAFAAVLAAEGVLSMRQKGDQTEVDLDNLPLPDLYGKGTEHGAGDDFDWSGWFTQWGADEE